MIIRTEEKILHDGYLYNSFTLTDSRTGKVRASGRTIVSDDEILALYDAGGTDRELSLEDVRTLVLVEERAKAETGAAE